MKRLVPCLLLMSFLTSCEQPEYYDAGYDRSVRPHAQIYNYDEQPHDYHHSRHRQPKAHSKQGNAHGHEANNVHGHEAKNVHGHEASNVHGHEANNVHDHDSKKGPVVRHPSESGTQVISHPN